MPISPLHSHFPHATWTSNVIGVTIFHFGSIPKDGYHLSVVIDDGNAIATYHSPEGGIRVTRKNYVEAIAELKERMAQDPPWKDEEDVVVQSEDEQLLLRL